MAQPVVEFEIIGTDPERLRSYFGELFGWEFDTSAGSPPEVSEPANYGFVAPVPRPATKPGMAGGVGGGAGYDEAAYVLHRRSDVEAALQRAERASAASARWARPEAPGQGPGGGPFH